MQITTLHCATMYCTEFTWSFTTLLYYAYNCPFFTTPERTCATALYFAYSALVQMFHTMLSVHFYNGIILPYKSLYSYIVFVHSYIYNTLLYFPYKLAVQMSCTMYTVHSWHCIIIFYKLSVQLYCTILYSAFVLHRIVVSLQITCIALFIQCIHNTVL